MVAGVDKMIDFIIGWLIAGDEPESDKERSRWSTVLYFVFVSISILVVAVITGLVGGYL